MTPVTQPVPLKRPATKSEDASAGTASKATPTAPRAQDDGTALLLKSGGGTLATGIFLALLTRFALGGIGPQGPHTNSGWMALIVTMMCLPFGFLLFLLGALKWLRRRRYPNS